MRGDGGISAISCPLCGSQASVIYDLSFSGVAECGGCRAQFLYPFPETAEIESIYQDQDYFEGEFATYFGAQSPESLAAVHRDNREILDLIDSRPRGCLLDVGCATGIFLEQARDQGWDVRGVELSKWAADIARTQRGVEVFSGSLEEAGFPDGSFDVVTALDVLEHVATPQALLREIFRILRPGGIAIINTISRDSIIMNIAALLHFISIGSISSGLERVYGAHHLWYFSRTALTDIINGQGGKIIMIDTREYAIDRIANVSLLQRLALHIVYIMQSAFGRRANFIVIAGKTADYHGG